MSSPRVRRMLTLPLACALSLTAAAEVAGQALPTLPAVPPVQLPSLPKAPPLKPPSTLEVPSGPQTPSVPVPRPSVPSPSVPATPAAPRSSSPASPRVGARQTGAPLTGRARGPASSRPPSSPAERRRASARRRAVATPRERRFQRTVKSLWACSYAIGGFERGVLVRRAGLDGFTPATAANVAGRLNVSVQRVRAAQRTGLRRLRRADRSDGCAMSAPTGELDSSAQILLAVATAPPLASDAGGAMAEASERPAANDRVEVLGAQRASTGVRANARAKVTLASTGDAGSAPWLLIVLALLAVAIATPLALRRRHEAAETPQAIAPPPPDPEPTPPPTLPPVTPLPPAPAPAPEPAEPSAQPQRRGAARTAGLAVTGLASLAVTLLLRSRRKR